MLCAAIRFSCFALLVAPGGAIALGLAGSAARPAQTACEKLTTLRLHGAKVLSAAMISPADIPATPTRLGAHAAEHCEVQGVATPTSDSIIHFTLWLPPADRWNGKYLQKGSGGWGGEAYSYALITPLNRGYAAAVTDDGHRGDGTARFAVGHPEKLIDFGHRAIHETSRQSRVILNAFYGKAHTQAYFVGCSDGGREALIQAQRYPEDFNGIVAGAPANNWTHQLAGFVWYEKALLASGTNILPASKLAVLQGAAIKACDAKDGVRDGIIDNPRDCEFDPAVLLCTAGDGDDCLTGPQIDAVKKIYSGASDPVTGKPIIPGFEPGMEAYPSTWKLWLLESMQAKFGNSNFADVVYEGRPWDWRTSNLHDDVTLADEKEAPHVNATNPDLRTFRAHGGKLIVYHGWGDAAVAPQNSIDYYHQVRDFLATYPDARAPAAAATLDDFYLLFMVPGMSHCWGGVGPDSFGNEEVPAPALVQDADHDVVLALDRWVVDSRAPERIVATKLPEQNSAQNLQREIVTRPLCAYPKVARYQGKGSTNDAINFQCVAPP
ncbi:MAG TPA: tannase/feruloyl esterase family alpha/beta hydrolase [Steroidobacteraceae bacterium]|nr:tannase/feruloyl esterase family alpha/beta hydrolase [Steroidobacteraceae bacterium]